MTLTRGLSSIELRMKPFLILCADLSLLTGCRDAPSGDPLKTTRIGSFVFEYPAEEEGNVRALAEQCAEIEERLTEDLGQPFSGDVRVRIADSEEAFLAAWPGTGRAEKWAAAVANPGKGMIVMKSPKLLLGSRRTYDKIFVHEVAHIALHRALTRPPVTGNGTIRPQPTNLHRISERGHPEIPRWLHEGYSQYLSRQWSPSQELLLTRAVLRKDLIPLGSLVRGFPKEEDRARLAYAESADLVHYLIRHYGNEAFHRFLYAQGTEGSFGAACRQVFQASFLQVEKEWKRHLQRRYTWIPLLGSTGTLWFLTTVVFLAAYLRKRVSNRKKLKQWSEEDTF